MKKKQFNNFLFIFLLISCSTIDKKQDEEIFFQSRIKGLKSDEFTTPHALPLFILYIDYIKNNRCSGRRNLSNFYFNQLSSVNKNYPSKVRFILERICKETKNVKTCHMIHKIKFKKDEKTFSGFKDITFLNLFFKEFSGGFHFKNKLAEEDLFLLNPLDDVNYWFDNYPVKKSKKRMYSFLQNLKTNKKRCLQMFDRSLIYQINNDFELKFRVMSNGVLDVKDHDLIKDLNWKKEVRDNFYKELYQEYFYDYGKRNFLKYHIGAHSDFCEVEDNFSCDPESSYICLLRDLKGKTSCTEP